MPLKDFRATLSVEAVDTSSSRVVWHAEFAPTGISAADAEAAVGGVFDGGLERLATDA